MEKRLFVFLAIVLMMAIGSTVDASVRSSADYSVTKEVLSTSGCLSTSSHYSHGGTMGQGAQGLQSSGSYAHQGGFWHTVLTPPVLPALSVTGIFFILLVIGYFLYTHRRKGVFVK